ncbi:hypothetical protein J8273_2734 [Carpediemonas membranifera]|uniref:Tyrosine-protein kinase ephrin type A/B receptor-like domain-containing protein n=1 Tax=Carpediemonas membranifera TaxID=201153 RepID=A0A8J6B9Z8_9EUKA|nr:hypothetical protein J8273_2734 [Carpediemonas membranifera]|eukprot:KAG9395822.1 hypothetical protein J8273_2734 [Carpediemonas membranifera]
MLSSLLLSYAVAADEVVLTELLTGTVVFPDETDPSTHYIERYYTIDPDTSVLDPDSEELYTLHVAVESFTADAADVVLLCDEDTGLNPNSCQLIAQTGQLFTVDGSSLPAVLWVRSHRYNPASGFTIRYFSEIASEDSPCDRQAVSVVYSGLSTDVAWSSEHVAAGADVECHWIALYDLHALYNTALTMRKHGPAYMAGVFAPASTITTIDDVSVMGSPLTTGLANLTGPLIGDTISFEISVSITDYSESNSMDFSATLFPFIPDTDIDRNPRRFAYIPCEMTARPNRICLIEFTSLGSSLGYTSSTEDVEPSLVYYYVSLAHAPFSARSFGSMEHLGAPVVGMPHNAIMRYDAGNVTGLVIRTVGEPMTAQDVDFSLYAEWDEKNMVIAQSAGFGEVLAVPTSRLGTRSTPGFFATNLGSDSILIYQMQWDVSDWDYPTVNPLTAPDIVHVLEEGQVILNAVAAENILVLATADPTEEAQWRVYVTGFRMVYANGRYSIDTSSRVLLLTTDDLPLIPMDLMIDQIDTMHLVISCEQQWDDMLTPTEDHIMVMKRTNATNLSVPFAMCAGDTIRGPGSIGREVKFKRDDPAVLMVWGPPLLYLALPAALGEGICEQGGTSTDYKELIAYSRPNHAAVEHDENFEAFDNYHRAQLGSYNFTAVISLSDERPSGSSEPVEVFPTGSTCEKSFHLTRDYFGSCQPCPTGSFNRYDGSSRTTCEECPEGSYCPPLAFSLLDFDAVRHHEASHTVLVDSSSPTDFSSWTYDQMMSFTFTNLLLLLVVLAVILYTVFACCFCCFPVYSNLIRMTSLSEAAISNPLLWPHVAYAKLILPVFRKVDSQPRPFVSNFEGRRGAYLGSRGSFLGGLTTPIGWLVWACLFVFAVVFYQTYSPATTDGGANATIESLSLTESEAPRIANGLLQVDFEVGLVLRITLVNVGTPAPDEVLGWANENCLQAIETVGCFSSGMPCDALGFECRGDVAIDEFGTEVTNLTMTLKIPNAVVLPTSQYTFDFGVLYAEAVFIDVEHIMIETDEVAEDAEITADNIVLTPLNSSDVIMVFPTNMDADKAVIGGDIARHWKCTSTLRSVEHPRLFQPSRFVYTYVDSYTHTTTFGLDGVTVTDYMTGIDPAPFRLTVSVDTVDTFHYVKKKRTINIVGMVVTYVLAAFMLNRGLKAANGLRMSFMSSGWVYVMRIIRKFQRREVKTDDSLEMFNPIVEA